MATKTPVRKIYDVYMKAIKEGNVPFGYYVPPANASLVSIGAIKSARRAGGLWCADRGALYREFNSGVERDAKMGVAR
jgi:hypothetical protein